MTPMKRFNLAISNFKKNLSPFFKDTNLNKSEPKYNPYSHENGYKSMTKGVEADFISIFKSSHHDTSFALSYQYIDLKEEEQTVVFSMKKRTSEDITYSLPMKLEEFRSTLNKVNKELAAIKVNRLNEIKILEIVSLNFLNQKLSLEEEIKTVSKEVKKTKKETETKLNFKNLEKVLEEKTEVFESSIKDFEKKYNAFPEHKKIEKLKEELKKLNQSLLLKQEKLRNDMGMMNIFKEFSEASENFKNAEEEVMNTVENKLNEYPKIIGKNVRKKY